VPSWIYQRYSQLWKRVVLAACWAGLYVLVDAGIGALPGLEQVTVPVEWRIVLAACIFIGGIFKPVVAYIAFVVAIAYPLYLVSIYLMALALAVLILCAPLAARVLPLVLMLVGAPVLAPFHLTPVLPLLFGLWSQEEPMGQWGKAGGTIAGGLCALWLKICAGMAGSSLDLWHINGWSMTAASIYERYHAANSLRTLLQLIEPLTEQAGGSTSTVLLFHLLQVFAWAGAAYVVGAMRDLLLLRKAGAAGHGSAWTSVLSLVPGLIVIWAGFVAVPSWLQVPGPRWLDPLWLPAQIVLAGVVALGVDGLLRYLQQPLYVRQRSISVSIPPGGDWRKAKGQTLRRSVLGRPWFRRSAAGKDVRAPVPGDLFPASTGARGRRAEAMPDAVADRPERKRDAGDDIIMIELD
jgi:hypothetical protein